MRASFGCRIGNEGVAQDGGNPLQFIVDFDHRHWNRQGRPEKFGVC
jgi:hypothetical protein